MVRENCQTNCAACLSKTDGAESDQAKSPAQEQALPVRGIGYPMVRKDGLSQRVGFDAGESLSTLRLNVHPFRGSGE